MKTFNIDFNLSAWMNIEIEAESEEEALDQLYRMDVADIVREGNIKESDISDEKTHLEKESDRFLVKCTDINWDTDDEEVDLPSEVTMVIDVDSYDGEITNVEVEDAIGDKLCDRYGFCQYGVTYSVLASGLRAKRLDQTSLERLAKKNKSIVLCYPLLYGCAEDFEEDDLKVAGIKVKDGEVSLEAGVPLKLEMGPNGYVTLAGLDIYLEDFIDESIFAYVVEAA